MPVVRYVVRGRVQGVGFRWFVLREAERLGIHGWARNLPDGGVEVVADATTEHLASLETALHRGPVAARVDSVEKADLSHQTDIPKTFDIT
jgi:acylphosphatase